MSQKKAAKENYRLYAAMLNEKTMRAALETPYARISGGYALIYKRGKAPDGYREMTGKALGLLTDAEKQWLEETNIAIMEQFVKKHEEAQKRGIRKFAARFEEELRAERERLEGKGNAAAD